MVDRRGMVLVVALMAAGGLTGCAAPVATTTPIVTSTPTATAPASAAPSPVQPTPAPAAALDFPARGALAAGTHAATVEGISFTFEAPTSEWVADHGRTWAKLDLDREGPLDGLPDGAAVLFWSPDGAYLDPCAHTRGRPVGSTPADLAAAMSTVPGVVVASGPSDVMLGGLSAVLVELAVPDEAGCAPEALYLWYDTVEAWRWATALGDPIHVWIVEVGGARLVIETETRKSSSTATRDEVQGLIESIRFE